MTILSQLQPKLNFLFEVLLALGLGYVDYDSVTDHINSNVIGPDVSRDDVRYWFQSYQSLLGMTLALSDPETHLGVPSQNSSLTFDQLCGSSAAGTETFEVPQEHASQGNGLSNSSPRPHIGQVPELPSDHVPGGARNKVAVTQQVRIGEVQDSLSQSLESEGGSATRKCRVCDKICSNKKSRADHERRQCWELYLCGDCEFEHSRKSRFTEHLGKEHLDKFQGPKEIKIEALRRLHCKWCLKNLKNCDFCGTAGCPFPFKDLSSARKHLWRHIKYERWLQHGLAYPESSDDSNSDAPSGPGSPSSGTFPNSSGQGNNSSSTRHANTGSRQSRGTTLGASRQDQHNHAQQATTSTSHETQSASAPWVGNLAQDCEALLASNCKELSITRFRDHYSFRDQLNLNHESCHNTLREMVRKHYPNTLKTLEDETYWDMYCRDGYSLTPEGLDKFIRGWPEFLNLMSSPNILSLAQSGDDQCHTGRSGAPLDSGTTLIQTVPEEDG